MVQNQSMPLGVDFLLPRGMAVLKFLLVTTVLMFTTAALAQSPCQSVNDIHRNLNRIVDRIELVPPDEANYIRAEKVKTLEQQNRGRFNAVYNRRFYAATEFHNDAAVVIQNVVAAEGATSSKDVASYLIVVLSRLSDLKSSMDDFIQADSKRQQPTLSPEDKSNLSYDITALKGLTTNILQCVVRRL